MLRRLPRRQQAIGVFIGFIGVVLIALPTLGEGSSSSTGVGLILIALVSYGVSVNVIVPLQHRYGSLPVLWRIQIVAFILILPFGVAGLGDSSFEWRPFFAVLALGVLGTGYVYVRDDAGGPGWRDACVVDYIPDSRRVDRRGPDFSRRSHCCLGGYRHRGGLGRRMDRGRAEV